MALLERPRARGGRRLTDQFPAGDGPGSDEVARLISKHDRALMAELEHVSSECPLHRGDPRSVRTRPFATIVSYRYIADAPLIACTAPKTGASLSCAHLSFMFSMFSSVNPESVTDRGREEKWTIVTNWLCPFAQENRTPRTTRCLTRSKEKKDVAWTGSSLRANQTIM